jgi:ATP-dependent DNA helicase
MIDIPQKREYILYAPITNKQRELYDAVLKNDLEGALKRIMFKEIFGENYKDLQENEENESGVTDSKKNSAIADSLINRRRRSTRQSLPNYEIPEEDDLEHRIIVPLKKDLKSEKENLEKHIRQIVGKQNLKHSIVQLRKICNHPYLFRIGNDGDEPLDLNSSDTPEILAWSGKMVKN